MSKIKILLSASMAFALICGTANAQITVTSNFDPVKSLIDKSAPEINVVELDKKTLAIIMQNIENGYWSISQGKSGAPKGEYCTALFVRKDMSVSLSGPGGNYKMALLNFMGLDKSAFPTPNGSEKMKINFKQGKESPVDITAINTSVALPNGEKMGVISLPVPTIQALMDGMEDNYRFVIKYNGNQIADIEWNKGLLARDELKKCLAGSTTPFTTKLK
ncbi:MAG: hypothetical protein J0L55_17170 [Caulobacterales bacterium]|nr:hypothetical protein [Caulobacterales bacterium]MCA0373400.1 hypothetical protein [Pseudomonadota bacterium]